MWLLLIASNAFGRTATIDTIPPDSLDLTPLIDVQASKARILDAFPAADTTPFVMSYMDVQLARMEIVAGKGFRQRYIFARSALNECNAVLLEADSIIASQEAVIMVKNETIMAKNNAIEKLEIEVKGLREARHRGTLSGIWGGFGGAVIVGLIVWSVNK